MWVREEVHGRVPEAPTPTSGTPDTQFFDLDDDSVPELGGSRPDRLADVRPQERVPRRIVEQIVDFALLLFFSTILCRADGRLSGGSAEDPRQIGA